MAATPKSKEIQVQRPAQSLQAFQQTMAAGDAVDGRLLRQVLIGGVAVVAGVVGYFAFSSWQSSVREKHESAFAELVHQVQGDGLTASAPAEVEKRMRESLPRLESLAKNAPSACRAEAQATLAAWKLQLDGKGSVESTGSDPWSRLRLAQRHLALQQEAEAAAALAPLRPKAGPEEAWAGLFWTTLMDLHRLKGDRSQALKDLADYKGRFKEKANPSVERLLAGI